MRCTSELGAALWLAAVAGLFATAACGEAGAPDKSEEPLSCAVSYEDFAGPLLLNWCVGCHSSALPAGERENAPLGVDFDTLDGIRKHAPRIRARTVEQQTMPPLGGPTAEERALLGEWLDCGAPAASGGFMPPPPSGRTTPEPPTGACAEPVEPLPEAAFPRCSAATLECIVGCTSLEEPAFEACRDACVAADTTPPLVGSDFSLDCSTCRLLSLLHCADTHGCQPQTAAFLCCIEACSSEACIAEQCSGELAAFGLCVAYSAPECVDDVNGPGAACFAR